MSAKKTSSWTDADHRWLSDLIMLISVDANPTADLDQLESRMLAIRELIERGHPAIQDNAQWRKYDFQRALLERIVKAPRSERLKLTVYDRLNAQDTVVPDETSGPIEWRYPRTEIVLGQFEQTRVKLTANPRWRSTIERRDTRDRALIEAARMALPQTRKDDWELPRLPQNAGDPESWSTLIRVTQSGIRIDDEPFSLDRPDDSVRLRDKLALRGDRSVVLAVDSLAPAPEVHTLLAELSKAGIERAELAAYP